MIGKESVSLSLEGVLLALGCGFGLFLSKTRTGDVVAVLFDGSVPCVLRKKLTT